MISKFLLLTIPSVALHLMLHFARLWKIAEDHIVIAKVAFPTDNLSAYNTSNSLEPAECKTLLALCFGSPELSNKRSLEPHSFAWASIWSQMIRQRQYVSQFIKADDLLSHLHELQTVSWNHTILERSPLCLSGNGSRGSNILFSLQKPISQVVIERCFLISPGLLWSVSHQTGAII